jgi:hypothetical protein
MVCEIHFPIPGEQNHGFQTGCGLALFIEVEGKFNRSQWLKFQANILSLT